MIINNTENASPVGEFESPNKTWPSDAARAAVWGVGAEQVDEVEATVRGTIPSWLAGTRVMNGVWGCGVGEGGCS